MNRENELIVGPQGAPIVRSRVGRCEFGQLRLGCRPIAPQLEGPERPASCVASPGRGTVVMAAFKLMATVNGALRQTPPPPPGRGDSERPGNLATQPAGPDSEIAATDRDSGSDLHRTTGSHWQWHAPLSDTAARGSGSGSDSESRARATGGPRLKRPSKRKLRGSCHCQ
jgi:hypothetical protein